MEIGQFKKSMQEIAKTIGAVVEEKLGDRSQLEFKMVNFRGREPAERET